MLATVRSQEGNQIHSILPLPPRLKNTIISENIGGFLNFIKIKKIVSRI